MIFKNLMGRKARTFLTVAGVAIGVAAIVALGALSGGLAAAYGAIAGGSKADMLVAQADAVDIVFSSVDQHLADRIAAIPGVDEVTSMVYTMAASGEMPYFIVFGYDPQGFAIEHFEIIEGQGLDAPRVHGGGRPVIIGRTVAEDLDKHVGDTIRFYDITFRIVGIYRTGEAIEDSAAVVSIEDAQDLSKKPYEVNACLLRLDLRADP